LAATGERVKTSKVPRQRWHSWHCWQCGLCNLQNLEDARGTESLSLRQLNCSTDWTSYFRVLPSPRCLQNCGGFQGTRAIGSRCRVPRD
jgi:hypothetical protein